MYCKRSWNTRKGSWASWPLLHFTNRSRLSRPRGKRRISVNLRSRERVILGMKGMPSATEYPITARGFTGSRLKSLASERRKTKKRVLRSGILYRKCIIDLKPPLPPSSLQQTPSPLLILKSPLPSFLQMTGWDTPIITTVTVRACL